MIESAQLIAIRSLVRSLQRTIPGRGYGQASPAGTGSVKTRIVLPGCDGWLGGNAA